MTNQNGGSEWSIRMEHQNRASTCIITSNTSCQSSPFMQFGFVTNTLILNTNSRHIEYRNQIRIEYRNRILTYRLSIYIVIALDYCAIPVSNLCICLQIDTLKWAHARELQCFGPELMDVAAWQGRYDDTVRRGGSRSR